tara:strand:+ start:23927 stop:24427 length:501 start_codon:yes stop_codon:yes gene_type:complete
MKRLCFVAPNLTISKIIEKELKQFPIQDGHFFVLGQNLARVDDANMQAADLTKTSDLVPSIKRGIILSLFIMIAFFTFFYFLLPEGTQVTPLAAAGIVVFSILYGAWTSSMIGIGIPTKEVEASSEDIKAGQYLIIVDIPEEIESDVTNKILNTSNEVHLAAPHVD